MSTKKKHWSKLDEEKRLCEEWLNEPLVNPKTGHSIERNGPTFLMFKEQCTELGLKSVPIATKTITWRKCQEWKRYPTINPDTGRKISKNGPTYKWIEKQCKSIEEKELSLLGEYYLPDGNGMVPCVKWRDTFYVLRKYNDRKIWGPLNKHAKDVQLCYFLDTWDYRYNHYRPIFMNGRPPRRFLKRVKPKIKDGDWLSSTCNKPIESPKYIVDHVVDLFIDNPQRG